MIKAVIFDQGGVIACEDWNVNREHVFSKLIKLIDADVEKAHELFDFYYHDKGLVYGRGDEDEFFSELVKLSPNVVSSVEAKKLYYTLFYLHEDVFRFARRLSKKHALYMLSNDVKPWFDYKARKFGFRKVFRKLFCSADIGMKKPEARIYEYVIKELGIAPQEILFIDNQENNVNGAQSAGMNTILFVSLGQLKNDLERFGIKE
jgi:epoxide hydrolase-like predicted phosphatase